jgi:hypothetical protein
VIVSRSIVLHRLGHEVRRGRDQVTALLRNAGVELGVDSERRVRTVASDLITNTMLCAEGPVLQVVLHADLLQNRLLIDVHDGPVNRSRPRTLRPDPDPRTRLCMYLVQIWSLAWGADLTDTGIRRWAMLALPAQPRSRRQLLLGRRAAALRASKVVVHPVHRGCPGRRAPLLAGAERRCT